MTATIDTRPFTQAHMLQHHAKQAGFHWSNVHDIIAKLREETHEIEQACHADDRINIAEEIGDALFTLVALAQYYHMDAAIALHDANQKFSERFHTMQQCAKDDKITLHNMTEKQREAYWLKAKAQV